MPLADTLNRKPGDILKSDDWNVIIKEVDRKINRDGADTLKGPLTITEALNAYSNVTISGNLSVKNVLEIGNPPFAGNTGGNRDWMQKGIKINWDGDSLFIGLKDEGTNRKDAVIAWGDDPQDDLRFVNVLAGGEVQGKELMRIKPSGNVGIGTNNPVASLDIASASRTGTHPTAIKGLYITGDFNADNDGVEFRHSSGTQGIGFGFNTIYAAGSNPNQDLQLKPKGTGEVKVAGNLSATGSVSFGSQVRQMLNLWSTGYGIGVQNLTQYFRSDANFAWYKGGSHNDAELNAGGGTSLMTLDKNGVLSVSGIVKIGSLQLGGFTSEDKDEWPNVVWSRDLSQNWDEGLIKHSSDKGVFKKAGFGIHFHEKREFGFWSTGWNPLFAVDGGTGNTYIRGNLKINGAITPSVGNSENNGIMFPKDPGGGGGDAAWIRYYVRGGEATTFEIGTSNDSDDHIALMPNAGNVGIGTTSPLAKLHIKQTGINSGIRLEEFDGQRFFNIAYEDKGIIHFYHQNTQGQWMEQDGNWHHNSDISLKKDISSMYDILDKVIQLNPVHFTWKDSNISNIGFIAQEVQQIFPEIVSSVNINGDKLKGLSYASFAVLAIAAIKDMKSNYDQEVKILQEQIKNLQEQILTILVVN